MKKFDLKKMTAAAAAFCVAVSMLAACGNDNDTDTNTSEASSSETTVSEELTVSVPEIGTMREVAEGDVFAINKFAVNELPEGYELALKSQKNGAQFLRYIIDGGKAQVSVEASNYREDFQSLDIFAETACASMKINNLYYHCDTEFSEPEKTTAAGFDAIKYDYNITQNDYEWDEEGNVVTGDDGEELRFPVEWYSGRAYFFYSDEDAFYVIFETTKDNWDNSIDTFEKFMSEIFIDENAVNDVEETEEVSGTSAE